MRFTNIMIMFLVFALVLPSVYATLQVTAFSCNGESGTVVVENGQSFSCTATINNPDSENSATLNSVTLYADGTWLESTSYAGSGFSTSISATASTTATFTGLISVSSGLNNFDYISLDGVTDAYVADTTINVVSIKSLGSSAPSNATEDSEFSVSGSVTAGGNLDVTLAMALSGGCSLVTGDSSSKSIGSMSHNTQATESWSITMGSNDCGYTITATGTQSTVSVSDTTSGTVTKVNGTGDNETATDGGGGRAGIPQCADGIDNDGDGFIDLKDLGCVDQYDDDETDPLEEVPAGEEEVIEEAPTEEPSEESGEEKGRAIGEPSGLTKKSPIIGAIFVVVIIIVVVGFLAAPWIKKRFMK